MHLDQAHAYRVRWLVVYWGAVGIALTGEVLAFSDVAPAEARLAISLGLLAIAGSATMATDLHRRRLPAEEFDKATAGARVAGIGWWLLVVVLVVFASAESGLGATRDVDTDSVVASTTTLVAALVGVAALTKVVGEGWTEYKAAVARHPHRSGVTA
ncbi:hypothetical protein [Klenkia sp. PcliD-1-E]|uniref:hypothetical protein n=1 Tax=Klenkia sp. PcliD-1-E TaxID=2954492 RepID=UPI00209687E2|nr:hypothetical protein [Klenkia sp. PcliD-1-E]MCO7221823.1 hypothetical protein [Klenkia sp. PcliD-1-E]